MTFDRKGERGARERERERERMSEESITRVEKILNSLSCVRYAIGSTFRTPVALSSSIDSDSAGYRDVTLRISERFERKSRYRRTK